MQPKMQPSQKMQPKVQPNAKSVGKSCAIRTLPKVAFFYFEKCNPYLATAQWAVPRMLIMGF